MGLKVIIYIGLFIVSGIGTALDIDSVSYTHLDVYKRQIYTWYTSDIQVVYTYFY